MTVRQLAEGVAADTRLLSDQTRLRNDVAELAQLTEELVGLSSHLVETMRLGRVLEASRILGKQLKPPQGPLAQLSALTNGNEFVENPLAKARGPIKELTAWVNRTNDELMRAFRSWCDDVLPNLTGVETFAELLMKVDTKVGMSIRGPIAEAKIARANPPHTVEDIDHVRDVAEKVRSATAEYAPTPAIERFLRELLGPGAPFDALTDEIKAWIEERDLWPSLRIRLGDARG